MSVLTEKKIFRVKFNHIISPNVSFDIKNSSEIDISGNVKIDIENLLGNFSSGLGLKNIFSKVIEKKVTKEGYFMFIKDIANASITLNNKYQLIVSADYRPSKEWWAKPIALTVLSKFLNDFSYKLINSGVTPGFETDIKKALQDLRKYNKATLELKNLFEKQNFSINNKYYLVENFSFKKVETYSENSIFVINFIGNSNFVNK
ncbi:MAG: hypothetical protein AABZ74_18510 [Cyanobacteriota bacterium]